MHKILSDLAKDFSFSDSVEDDYYRFFTHHGKQDIAEHSCKVAKEAIRLALQYGVNAETARIASYLHDISRVFPDNEYLNISHELGIEVNEEEKAYPMLLHQKVSKLMAKELFRIEDESALNAIGCHTTLKKNPSKYELILFISDKLSWDEADSKPILKGILNGLETSLEHGAYSYIKYLWDNKENIKVLHPWTASAYIDLDIRCRK